MRTMLTATLLAGLAIPAGAQPRHDERTVIRDVRVYRHVRDTDVRKAYADREAGQRQESREQVDRSTRTLKVGANGEVVLYNISGDIVVARGGGSDVTVEIVKSSRGRTDEDAREMLQLVQVEVIERAGRAEVRARYPEGDDMRRNNRRNVNVSVSFNVTAPANVRIRAHSISGSITATDVKGEIAAESVSGNVRIANGGRISGAKSISGNVEITDTEIDGLFNASSASGSVILRRVKARQLDLGSISGSVVLDEVDCQQVEAQTVSGDVKFGGPLARSGRYELSSHSGTVTVAVSGSPGFEVEATSFSGSIRSDFSFNNSDPGSRGRRSLRGVHGDGSAVLDLTTFSGSIVISKR